jgi:hypothetical protein
VAAVFSVEGAPVARVESDPAEAIRLDPEHDVSGSRSVRSRKKRTAALDIRTPSQRERDVGYAF